MTAAPRLAELFPATTDGPAATMAFGERLAAYLGPGDVVALFGDLGAGKTHLAKGVCRAFGVAPETVNSPTFTLVNEYAGAAFPIYHFDAYRIRHLDEFFEMGYEEYFFGEALCLIEWPERIEPLLPAHTLRLHLRHAGDTHRQLVLAPV